MKGHIRERSPGRWAIVLEMRDPETGKRKRKWHSFKGNKRAAQIECARLISELSAGNYLEPGKTTFAVYLDQWLAHVKPRVTLKTYERYSELVAKNIKPALGGLIVTQIKPAQISNAYTKALATGRRDGKGGLSPATVLYMHRLIKQALAQAVKWLILSRNPADAVQPPKLQRKPMNTYNLAQTAELVDRIRGSRAFISIALAVLCGLRRGEIAALRWRHIDVTTGNLTVIESAEQTKDGVRYKVPKSGRGRTVALTASMVAELKAHRITQAKELLRIGIRQSEATFICSKEDGQPLQPRSISQAWRQALAISKMDRIRFHDLRHAHATHLLGTGIHPKIASERLGHSKVGITLDLYSHVLPGMQEDAAARVDEAFKNAVKKRADDIG